MKPPCGILPRVRGRAVPLAAVAALLAFAAVPALAAGRAPKSAARTPRRSVAPKAAEPAPSAFSGLVWHVETEAGAEVDGRLSDEPINPASVTKAATTLWALERLGPDHRFEGRPLGLEILFLLDLLSFCNLLELRIDLRPLLLVNVDLCETALVIDRDSCLVLDCPLDIVHADVVPEDVPGVLVLLLDRRAGEPDEGRPRKGVPDMAGEPVDEVVLAPVGFVRDDDDVPAPA